MLSGERPKFYYLVLIDFDLLFLRVKYDNLKFYEIFKVIKAVVDICLILFNVFEPI